MTCRSFCCEPSLITTKAKALDKRFDFTQPQTRTLSPSLAHARIFLICLGLKVRPLMVCVFLPSPSILAKYQWARIFGGCRGPKDRSHNKQPRYFAQRDTN